MAQPLDTITQLIVDFIVHICPQSTCMTECETVKTISPLWRSEKNTNEEITEYRH